MRRHLRNLAAAVAVTTAVTLGASPAAAAPASAPTTNLTQAAEETAGLTDAYSDREILELLFAGVGRVADENPELLRYLGFAEERPAADRARLAALIDEYLEFYPGFGAEVRPALVSGDPLRVEQALVLFTEKFHDYLKTELAETAPRGKAAGAVGNSTTGNANVEVGLNAYAIANAGVLVNAGLYANVAVATMAVVAGAAIWVVAIVTTYLSDGEMAGPGTEFEAQRVVAGFTSALHGGR